jgi:hypothetical protein
MVLYLQLENGRLKMKQQGIIVLVVLALVLGSLACSFSGFTPVRGSGHVVEENRAVSGFTGVNLATLGNLQIQLGDPEGLRIEAEDNLIPYLQTIVSGDQLEIGNRDGVQLRPTRPVNFYLTVKSLDSIALTGSGNIVAPDLKADQFRVRLSGSGDVKLGNLYATDIEMRLTGSGNLRVAGATAKDQHITLSGSGDVTLGNWNADTAEVNITGSGGLDASSGAVKEQRVTLSGSGEYRAKDVDSATTEARITGSGSMTVQVRDRLSAHISGSGSVHYAGNPQVETTVTGSGRVRPIS